jgi:hypothetical protein
MIAQSWSFALRFMGTQSELLPVPNDARFSASKEALLVFAAHAC